MKERRRSRRRSFPFVRSAVLEVDGRNHIVAVQDVAADGAFLSTNVEVTPEQKLRLRLVLPRTGRETMMPCQLVWRSERFDAATGRPAGIAVRFSGLDETATQHVSDFATEGLLPATVPAPAAHFEYRVVEHAELNVDELNRLGLDGWQLAATLPAGKGLRLVLLRKI